MTGDTKTSVFLQDALDHMDEGFTLWDENLRLVACNKPVAELLNFPESLSREGTHISELLAFNAAQGDYGEGDHEDLIQQRLSLLADPQRRTYLKHRPGIGILEMKHFPLDDGGLVITYRDVTKQIHAEEAMLESLDQAKLADQAKSQFLSKMSHELRTPLNAIIGFSEMISRATFGPVGSVKYLEYASDIHASGQHLLDVINDILDLSKVEAGTEDLHEEDIDVSALVNEIMSLVNGIASEGGIELAIDMVEGDLPQLLADKRKLKQIMVNLLSNAIKFTPAGGSVTLRAWHSKGDGWAFQVIDNGIGIAAEDIPKIMTPFQQVDNSNNREHKGTGLGLPLAKGLVELHGGSLDLHSQPGVGTRVTVKFPVQHATQLHENRHALDAVGLGAAG